MTPQEINQIRPHRPLIWPEITYRLRDFLQPFSREVYLVGGAVRDALLHRALHDIDLAVPKDAINLAKLIANYFNGDVFILDSDRKVSRVILDTLEGKLTLDVAAFRGTNLLDDLQDRDFTLNAMAVDAKGNLELLIDPLGGEEDIRKKVLRRCSLHALKADPVRVFRAVRQSIQLGFRIETSTLRDIKDVDLKLIQVSPERIRDEWFKILSLPRPVAAIRIMNSLKLLESVLPQTNMLCPWPIDPFSSDFWGRALIGVENLSQVFALINYTRTDNTSASFGAGMLAIQLDRFRKQLIDHLSTKWPNERKHSSLLTFALIVFAVSEIVTKDREKWCTTYVRWYGDQFRLSSAEVHRLLRLVQNLRLPLLLTDVEPLSIYRFWRQVGVSGIDLCFLAMADFRGHHGIQLSQDEWLGVIDRVRILLEAWYEKYDELISPPMLLDGKILLAKFDLKPGPIIGHILERIREAQVTGKVKSQDDALMLAQTLINDRA